MSVHIHMNVIQIRMYIYAYICAYVFVVHICMHVSLAEESKDDLNVYMCT